MDLLNWHCADFFKCLVHPCNTIITEYNDNAFYNYKVEFINWSEFEEAFQAICFNPFRFQIKPREFKGLVSKFLQKVNCKEHNETFRSSTPPPLYRVFTSHYTGMALREIFRQLSSII